MPTLIFHGDGTLVETEERRRRAPDEGFAAHRIGRSNRSAA